MSARMLSELPPELRNFAWMHQRLGGVPLDRIGIDPLPGTATEADVIRHLDGDDKRIYELVDGTLVEKAMGFRESMIGVYLSSEIRVYASRNGLGIVAGADGPFRLSAGSVRYPDVSFVPWSAIPDDAVNHKLSVLPPVLAVEVLSESNTVAEIDRKLLELFASSCRLAWVIDPEVETARVYTSFPSFISLNASEILDGGDVLPGFRLPLRDVFASGSLRRPT